MRRLCKGHATNVTNVVCDAAAVAVAAREDMAPSCARFAEADVDVELGREIGSVGGGAIACCSASMKAMRFGGVLG